MTKSEVYLCLPADTRSWSLLAGGHTDLGRVVTPERGPSVLCIFYGFLSSSKLCRLLPALYNVPYNDPSWLLFLTEMLLTLAHLAFDPSTL